MKRPKSDWRVYLGVFIITTIIFIAGILIGNTTSEHKLEEVKNLQDILKTETLDIELQYTLSEEEPCEYLNTTPLTKQLYDIAVKLTYMENILGKNNEEVIQLKKYYSLLEISNWLFEKKLNKLCNKNIAPILYFYSNLGDCEVCDEQGFVLTYLREKYESQILIYSFDINLELESLNFIKKKYNITTKTPTIIIKEKKYEGFISREELERIIEEEYV